MSFSERALWSNGGSISRKRLVEELLEEFRKEHGLPSFDAELGYNTYKYKNQSQNSHKKGPGFQNVLEGKGANIFNRFQQLFAARVKCGRLVDNGNGVRVSGGLKDGAERI